MKKIVFMYFGLCIFGSNLLLAHNKMVERAGDAGAFLIPISAGIIALSKGDKEGFSQMTEGAIWTLAVTHGTKYFVDAERPNKENLNSFPSGHASAAFQGAAFLHFRYGLKYSLPFYAASSFVGYSRVYSDWHYTRDVVAGALIAIGIQYIISKTNFSVTNYVISPYIDDRKTTGVLFTMKF